jgi:putative ATP-dependent endonuclease of the OLD family
MKIKKVNVKNYRSIQEANDLTFKKISILVGQNNHGKSNFFDSINWFFNGFSKGEDKESLIFSDADIETENILVEVVFTGLQEAIENMANANKKTAMQNIFGDEIDEILIRRTTEYELGKKRQLFNPTTQHWENTMGADGTWNDLLPHLEYVHTKVTLDDIGGYKSKSPISEMLSGILTSIIETDENYIELKNKFKELFGDETSEVRTKLNEISGKVEVYLQKQFPDNVSVKFNVDIPEFTDFLKKFSTEVNDGVPTLVEEKGDGMQRAVMLSIIQAYADFRKENDTAKKFIFLIDEAELHLHPSAQRALKKALIDVTSSGDQVFVNTHSSVLVVDNNVDQTIFKVVKTEKKTEIMEADEVMKMNIIYDLLGGSPSDLLLPSNFIIVEGQSEFIFLDIIIRRFYQDTFGKIKILFARGDVIEQEKRYIRVAETYIPLNNPIYKKRVIFLFDRPNQSIQSKYDEFKVAHPYLLDNEHLHQLPSETLEEYYPIGWAKNREEMDSEGLRKSSYAKTVANAITQAQFEQEMPVLFEALNKALEKGFN